VGVRDGLSEGWIWEEALDGASLFKGGTRIDVSMNIDFGEGNKGASAKI
jgi:hypothetical protein